MRMGSVEARRLFGLYLGAKSVSKKREGEVKKLEKEGTGRGERGRNRGKTSKEPARETYLVM